MIMTVIQPNWLSTLPASGIDPHFPSVFPGDSLIPRCRGSCLGSRFLTWCCTQDWGAGRGDYSTSRWYQSWSVLTGGHGEPGWSGLDAGQQWLLYGSGLAGVGVTSGLAWEWPVLRLDPTTVAGPACLVTVYCWRQWQGLGGNLPVNSPKLLGFF